MGGRSDIPEDGRRTELFEQELRSFRAESVLIATPYSLMDRSVFTMRTARRFRRSSEGNMGYKYNGVVEPIYIKVRK